MAMLDIATLVGEEEEEAEVGVVADGAIVEWDGVVDIGVCDQDSMVALAYDLSDCGINLIMLVMDIGDPIGVAMV